MVAPGAEEWGHPLVLSPSTRGPLELTPRRRQVSWLAGRALARLPGAFAPVAVGDRLAAHSCGGSRGWAESAPHSLSFPRGNRQTRARLTTESCVDFAEFAVDREQLLREFLSLKNGLPSHDTFSRVFRLLDPPPSRALRSLPRRSRRRRRRGAGDRRQDARAARSTARRGARRCTSSPPSGRAPGWRLPKGGGRGRERDARGPPLLETSASTASSSPATRCSHTKAPPRRSSIRAATILSRSRPIARRCCARSRPSSPTRPRRSRPFETTDADHGRIETRRHRRNLRRRLALFRPPLRR